VDEAVQVVPCMVGIAVVKLGTVAVEEGERSHFPAGRSDVLLAEQFRPTQIVAWRNGVIRACIEMSRWLYCSASRTSSAAGKCDLSTLFYSDGTQFDYGNSTMHAPPVPPRPPPAAPPTSSGAYVANRDGSAMYGTCVTDTTPDYRLVVQCWHVQ